MAFTNKETKEINCKVLLFGANSSNRREILRNMRGLVSKESIEDSFDDFKNSFSPFEFVPISIGNIRDYSIKLHIYSVSLQDNFDSTLMLLLKGVDIIGITMDSNVSSLSENLELSKSLDASFKKKNINFNAISKVYIYNQSTNQKQLSVEMMNREFNPSGELYVKFGADVKVNSSQILEKISQLALDQLLRSV